MIKKFLQHIFKKITYGFFLKAYGKIEKSITVDSDKRINVNTFNFEENLKYNIYKIIEGRLYTDRIQDLAVILDNKIIEGPSFQLRNAKDLKIYNSKITDNVVFQKGTPRKLRRLNGSVLSLLTGGGGNNNYWHWLFDVLPRLGLCSKEVNLNDINYFLLPDILKKFQKESLNYLKIPKNKWLSSRKFRHIAAKELILTDHPVVVTGDATKDIQNIPIWIIQWLRKNFVKEEGKNIENKVYIDRGEAGINQSIQRSIINESEVKNYLLNKNFKSVNLAEIDFTKQVELFSKANSVIGLHGAGFANIVFCKPGTKVVEFRSPTAGPVIENLAKKNNLKYSSIVIEPHMNNFPNQQGHIHVPIQTLSKII